MELLTSVGDDADLARQLSTSPVHSPTGSLLAPHTPTSPQALGPAGAPVTPELGQQEQGTQQHRTIKIVLSAVGVGLQFVHLEGGGGGGGASRPGSAGGSRPGSVADLAARAGPQQPPAQQPSQQGQGRAVQMLAAYLDLEADYQIEASGTKVHIRRT